MPALLILLEEMLCVRAHAMSEHSAVVQVSPELASCIAQCLSAVPLVVADIWWSNPTACRRSSVTSTNLQRSSRQTLKIIKAAYAAADLAALQSSPPFMVTTSKAPKLRGGRYEVEIKPLGYEASCTDEQVSMEASRHP